MLAFWKRRKKPTTNRKIPSISRIIPGMWFQAGLIPLYVRSLAKIMLSAKARAAIIIQNIKHHKSAQMKYIILFRWPSLSRLLLFRDICFLFSVRVGGWAYVEIHDNILRIYQAPAANGNDEKNGTTFNFRQLFIGIRYKFILEFFFPTLACVRIKRINQINGKTLRVRAKMYAFDVFVIW